MQEITTLVGLFEFRKELIAVLEDLRANREFIESLEEKHEVKFFIGRVEAQILYLEKIGIFLPPIDTEQMGEAINGLDSGFERLYELDREASLTK